MINNNQEEDHRGLIALESGKKEKLNRLNKMEMPWKSSMKENKFKRINKMQEIMCKLKKKKLNNNLLNNNSNNLKGNSFKIHSSRNNKGLNWLK